jgi:hypothetical protein
MILGNNPSQVSSNNTKLAERQPVFGILSIALPVVGILIAYLIGMAVAMPTDASGEPDSIGAFCIFAELTCFAMLSGFVSAIVALSRKERLMIFPFLGMLASAAPIVWFYLL